MILSALVLLGLLASSAAGSAVKGRVEEYRTSIKGDAPRQAAPVEYQRHYEQRTVAYAAKGGQEAPTAPEQTRLTESDLYQQREEAKSDRQQFYEAQPQLREADRKQAPATAAATKSEERAEEQTKLVQAPEPARFEDYQQQREEAAPVQQVRQEAKTAARQEQRSAYEATKAAATYDKYEAKQQVQAREEPVVAAAPVVPVPVAVPVVRAAKTEERHEEQVQYSGQAVEEQQQRYESQRDESRSKTVAVVQRAEPEQTRYVQQERQQEESLQQVVELSRAQEAYEQRRYEEQTEQRAEEQHQFAGQVREEQHLTKGGVRAPGAEAEPYAFDYAVDGSTRRESGDQNGVVRGQYTLQNPDGTQRIVDYVADQDGFRAQVRTNEFGTEGQQQQQQQQQQQVAVARAAYDTKTARYEPAPAVKSAAPVVQVAEVVRARPVQAAYEDSQRAAGYREASKGAPAAEQQPAQQLSEVKTAAAPVVVAFQPEPEYRAQQQQQQQQQRVEESPVQRAAAVAEPIKSAELRSPKSIGAVSSPARVSAVVTRASGFESATAHRPVVHSHPVSVVAAPAVAVSPAVPVVPVRHQPVVVQPAGVSVVRHQFVSPVRGYQSSQPQYQHAQAHHHHHHHHQYQQQYRQYHAQPSPVVAVPVGVHSSVSRSQLQYDRYPPAASYRREQPVNPRVSFYASNSHDESGFEHPAELI